MEQTGEHSVSLRRTYLAGQTMLKYREHCYGAPVSRWTRLHKHLIRARFLTLAGLFCTCGRGDENSSMDKASDRPSTASAPAVEVEDEDERFKFTEAFRTEPNTKRLLELLHQSHREVRSVLGPHHLHYTAQFEFKSADLPAKPQASKKSNAPQDNAPNRVDQLDLYWYGPDNREQQFMLSQHNDSGSSREITLDGLKIYARVDRPKWFVRDVENDHHEMWLNDAQRAVHDAIELAAKQLKLEDIQIVSDHDWGSALDIPLAYQAREISLKLRDNSNPAAQWRKNLKIDRIAGKLRLQRKSGIWLQADIDVRYHVDNREGRKFLGRVTLQANTAPIDPQTHPFSLPNSFLALPQRRRYVFEQRQMLKGLARP